MSAAGLTHLTKWYGLATSQDKVEGVLAYRRYHSIMCSLSEKYSVPLPQVVAAFVSLSPNSDYHSNLRSLVSVLHELTFPHDGVRPSSSHVQVATYRHCLFRAWAYVTGLQDFEEATKGLKVKSFYHNILDPEGREWVTVDGHIHALWQDKRLTMKEANISSDRKYAEIRDTIIAMADLLQMPPCQLQAILWFTRKRVLGIKSKADQGDLFLSLDDAHGSAVAIRDIKPYPPRRPGDPERVFPAHPQLL